MGTAPCPARDARPSVGIGPFCKDFFPQNEMKEGTRKGLCPQITPMNADEEFSFPYLCQSLPRMTW
jgi:hypothetical protein